MTAAAGAVTAKAAAARLSARRAVLAVTALAAAVELLPSVPAAVLAPAGLWLLLGAPVLLWRDAAARYVSTPDGCVLLAAGLAVLADIVAALLLNTVLPPIGAAHPLTRGPLAVTAVLAVVATAAACPVPERPARPARRWRRPRGLADVLVFGTVALVLGVAGAIRLDNGLGGSVSAVALAVVAALLLLLLRWRRRYPAPVLELGLYLAAAALLLLTSLRGWYITGHDIQREYEVFRLTADTGRWSIAAFRDPYNACLSVTVLPTALARLTGIGGVWVFKVLLPLLFALTPVLVYRSVRNVAPQVVALLSAVYFMAFPTFFTDMVFLARQEVAFLLLGCATVVLTDTGRPLRRRRAVFTVLLGGIALTHYSTTYVLAGVLAVAVAADAGWRLLARRRGTPAARAFLTWWMVAAVAAAAVLWTGPVTRTGGQARSTLAATAREVLGRDTRGGSSDVTYSLFGGAGASPAERLRDYRAETLRRSAAGRAAGDYLPAAALDGHAAPAVDEPDTPPTRLGRALNAHGVDVTAANGAVRQAAARLLQLLLLIGVATTVRARRRGFRPSRDQVTLTAGAVVAMGLLTVLPQLSVDYGVLRAFQQGLFFFAPFTAAGSLWIWRWAGRRAAPAACAVALLLMLDLTGLVPRLTGGYPAQLHLADSGQYYDIYYVSEPERAAAGWLVARTPPGRRPEIHSEVETDRYTFSPLRTLVRGRAQNDIYPTLVAVHAPVFLGSTTVRRGEATVLYRGDLVTYRYPTSLLDAVKDKLYSSEGAAIYR